MIYLCAIITPPLYFLIRKKWGALVFSLILLALAFVCVSTVVFAPGALVFWAIASVHAVWALRSEIVAKDAEVLATKIAEKMK